MGVLASIADGVSSLRRGGAGRTILRSRDGDVARDSEWRQTQQQDREGTRLGASQHAGLADQIQDRHRSEAEAHRRMARA